jgi:hypothetical protein
MGFADSPHLLVPREDLLALAEGATDGSVGWLRGDRRRFTVDGLWDLGGRAIDFDDADFAIDLRGAEFVDSATVRVINRTGESLGARSRSSMLRLLSRCARRILGLCPRIAFPQF